MIYQHIDDTPAITTAEGEPPPARQAPGLDATPNELDLLERARSGDTAAFEQLFALHHLPCRRYALRLSRTDADDLVSEAFTRTMTLLAKGAGPRENVRGYLFTAIRRAYLDDRTRRSNRLVLTGDDHALELAARDAPDFTDSAQWSSSTVAEAFQRLPERWRTILWHTIVEDRTPAQLSAQLGLSPNAVAALSKRARRGLQRSYLEIVDVTAPLCSAASAAPRRRERAL